jgi:Fe-S-cluster formation regulator IscX/YfhJ
MKKETEYSSIYLRFLNLIQAIHELPGFPQVDPVEERLLNALAASWHNERRVTVLEAMPDFLAAVDQQIAKEAHKIFIKQGLNIHMGVKIGEIAKTAKQITVPWKDASGTDQKLVVDKLIVSIGRVPYTGGLNADKVGLKLDERGFVTVDGDADLHRYKIADQAKIIAYIPDTVNSNNLIAIPTDQPFESPLLFKMIPNVDENDKMVRIAQVDLKLTSEGDLAVAAGGNVLLSFGLSNIIQASRIKIFTPTQSLLDSPDFGNPLQAGMNVADLDLKSTLDQLRALFTSDPRFSEIVGMQLTQKSTAATLNMLLNVTSVSSLIPIVTEIPK